jgi:Rps23 Pro-64 3,4-dihydroxylase Tpa1-like proline 4-hydroxylase
MDIEPVNSRLVLFSSHQTLHRVLPANKERYVITLWFSGTEMSLKNFTQERNTVRTSVPIFFVAKKRRRNWLYFEPA